MNNQTIQNEIQRKVQTVQQVKRELEILSGEIARLQNELRPMIGRKELLERKLVAETKNLHNQESQL